MEPKSLQQAILYFAKPENCREYLVARRWPDGVVCPRCGGKNVLFLEKYNRWHCRDKHAAPQFTLKTGTIFEGLAARLRQMAYGNVDDCELQKRDQLLGDFPLFGSNAKVRRFMDHRIRMALQSGSIYKMGGPGSEVEADETFVGGKAKNMQRIAPRSIQSCA